MRMRSGWINRAGWIVEALASDQQGQSSVLLVLALPALLLMAALMLNTGLGILQKLVLRGAVDAAARAAADAYDRGRWNYCQVLIEKDRAALLADEYLKRNMPQARLVSIEVSNDPRGSRATVTVTGAVDVPVLMPGLIGHPGNRMTIRSKTATTRTASGCGQAGGAEAS